MRILTLAVAKLASQRLNRWTVHEARRPRRLLVTLAAHTALDVSDLLRDAATAAPALLGWILVREDARSLRIARIVETEAYLPDDPACHAFHGPSRRNASMFGPAGHAYVYRIHRSFCLNVVTGPIGSGQAVLIRAIEPTAGVSRMQRARCRASVGHREPRGVALTNGPGKLCQALDVDLRLDGATLIGGREPARLRLVPGPAPEAITCTTRIGISRARELQLRFLVTGNAWVSS